MHFLANIFRATDLSALPLVVSTTKLQAEKYNLDVSTNPTTDNYSGTYITRAEVTPIRNRVIKEFLSNHGAMQYRILSIKKNVVGIGSK